MSYIELQEQVLSEVCTAALIPAISSSISRIDLTDEPTHVIQTESSPNASDFTKRFKLASKRPKTHTAQSLHTKLIKEYRNQKEP